MDRRPTTAERVKHGKALVARCTDKAFEQGEWLLCGIAETFLCLGIDGRDILQIFPMTVPAISSKYRISRRPAGNQADWTLTLTGHEGLKPLIVAEFPAR